MIFYLIIFIGVILIIKLKASLNSNLMILNFEIYLADTELHPGVTSCMEKILFAILLCIRLIFMTENYLNFTSLHDCAMLFLLQLSTLVGCCCHGKSFMTGMKSMMKPCMLLTRRESEAAMKVCKIKNKK